MNTPHPGSAASDGKSAATGAATGTSPVADADPCARTTQTDASAAQNPPGAIHVFAGEHAWLDNAYPAPVEMHGYVYPSVVNAYHAARMPRDKRHLFIMPSPAEAAAQGQRLAETTEFKRLRVPIMRMLLKSKFALGTDLAVKLIATEDLNLTYANESGDRFWGVCDGWGKNLLGLLLMLHRANLRIEILTATAPVPGVGIDPTRTTDAQAEFAATPFLMAQPAASVH